MNTKGWDTVCLVKTEHINQEIKNSWHSFNTEFAKTEVEYTINGKFKPWQIVEGGSNKLVRFKIPIESGVFRILEEGNSNVSLEENNKKEYDLSNCECIVELMMDFINTNDSDKLLKLNMKHFAKTRQDIINNNPEWVVPVLFRGDIPSFYQFVILEFVCQYLIEHPDQINFVFASINFAQDNKSWVTPVRCKFSYLDSRPSYMGILSVCDNKDITNMPVDIDVSPFSTNSNSYFIISSKLFLLNVMVSSLIKFFNNSNPSDYKVNDFDILINTRNLKMNSVKSGAIWYTPVIKKLEVSILGNKLNISIEGECDLNAGIWMYFKGNFKVCPILNNQTVEFRIDGTSSFEHNEDIPWYFSWLIPIVGWIAGIVINCISDDLMDSITKIFREKIRIDNISPVSWTNNPQNVKLNNVKFEDSFIIEYLII